MKKKKMKAFLKLFCIASVITCIVGFMIGIAGVTAYNTFIYQGDTVDVIGKEEVTLEEEEGLAEEEEVSDLPDLDKRINKTVAIFGTDFDGLLTDTLMVANINNVTKEINIISIPRDTQVKWTKEQKAYLTQRNKWVEVSKINEMTSWGGLENIRGLTVNEIERILGMKIDNYIVVSLSAFRDIIDAVGGVEVNVPQRMYKAEVNGGLCIDLQPGVQILDGNKAEQFVRFRDYRNGDLGRIEAQQQFVGAFMKKVVSPQIISKIPGIVATLFTAVKTDIKLTDLPIYYPYISQVSESEVNFYRAPGIDRRENGISYYFIDREEMDNLVETLFFNIEE